MRASFRSILFLLLLFPATVLGALSPVAQDRGRISLAWDAHEAGLFEEALGYLADISPSSPLAGEAAGLYAECLYDLGRFEKAADFLEGEHGRPIADREELLLDVYWDWTWDLTSRNAFEDARRVAERGLRHLPGEDALAGLAEASRFRERLTRAVPDPREPLPSGETVAVRPAGRPPRGEGWVQAFPWESDGAWVPRFTAEEWMPGLSARLREEGRGLWIKVPRGALVAALRVAAARAGLSVAAEEGGVQVVGTEDRVFLSVEEWNYRAAAEGLGALGAAWFALARARQDLDDRAAVARWVSKHREGLVAQWGDGVWRLLDPGTGRSFDLDPVHWGELLRTDPQQWEGLWADLRAELARPPRPYRCFCGRPAFLRQVLQREAGGGAVFERGPGFVVIMEVLCPLHRQYLTAGMAEAWGVPLSELAARAREDAERQPWDLDFSRDAWDGTPYLLLEGEGASSLARDPELLLGALEGVDGVSARGRVVRVLAPTPTSLLVADAETPESVAERAASASLLRFARTGDATERLGFRAVVHLPGRGRGSFRMTAAE